LQTVEALLRVVQSRGILSYSPTDRQTIVLAEELVYDLRGNADGDTVDLPAR
jgi:hypothetical protein